MWDERYAAEEYVYGKDPNDFLREMCPLLKKGSVLCLAEGEGRNAVFLARQGFNVTAVDSSRVGLAKADKLGKECGVAVDTVVADLADYTILPGARTSGSEKATSRGCRGRPSTWGHFPARGLYAPAARV